MKDTERFPQRKKIRLEGYDYASAGAYFVTVCVTNKNISLWQNVGADNIRPQEVCLSHVGKPSKLRSDKFPSIMKMLLWIRIASCRIMCI